MVYRAIGLAGDNPATGLEIIFTEFQEQAGKWTYEILNTEKVAYEAGWINRLENAGNLSISEFQQLHTEYGEYVGQQITKYIEQYQLHYKVALIAFPGFTLFSTGKAIQLGNAAVVAALTQLPVISNFYSVDTALGGHGANPAALLRSKILQEKLTPQSGEKVNNNAILVAFMGILRWRQEYNVFAAESGASRNSIGGALWTGQEA